jgi:hypothetical protein
MSRLPSSTTSALAPAEQSDIAWSSFVILCFAVIGSWYPAGMSDIEEKDPSLGSDAASLLPLAFRVVKQRVKEAVEEVRSTARQVTGEFRRELEQELRAGVTKPANAQPPAATAGGTRAPEGTSTAGDAASDAARKDAPGED